MKYLKTRYHMKEHLLNDSLSYEGGMSDEKLRIMYCVLEMRDEMTALMVLRRPNSRVMSISLDWNNYYIHLHSDPEDKVIIRECAMKKPVVTLTTSMTDEEIKQAFTSLIPIRIENQQRRARRAAQKPKKGA